MSKNKIIGIALAMLTVIISILYALKNTLLSSSDINYVGIIVSLVLIMNAILVLFLVPKEQNRLFVARPIGYGITLNPRNLLGLLLYLLLIVVIFLITA